MDCHSGVNHPSGYPRSVGCVKKALEAGGKNSNFDDPNETSAVLLIVMVSVQGKLTNGSNDLDPIGRFISDRSRMAPPTKEECDRLFEQMAQGSEEARKELIERHVVSLPQSRLNFVCPTPTWKI